MDVSRKWTDKDLAFIKLAVKYLGEIKVNPSWSGNDAFSFAATVQWIKDLKTVMENPPVTLPQTDSKPKTGVLKDATSKTISTGGKNTGSSTKRAGTKARSKGTAKR